MQKKHFYRVFVGKNMLNKLIFWENLNKKLKKTTFLLNFMSKNNSNHMFFAKKKGCSHKISKSKHYK